MTDQPSTQDWERAIRETAANQDYGDAIGIITFPEGTAVLNLHGLIETMVPVVVDYGGERFALTGWNDEHGVFDAIRLLPAETPQQARERIVGHD